MTFCLKTYLHDRHVRLVREKKCITCEAKHSGKHVRCDGCHEAHLEESRLKYTPRGTGYLCGACGNTGHNRRRCPQARAA